MTENKNANDSHESPTGGSNDNSGTDSDWQSFLDSHSDDLSDVESSHTARKFERHAKKEEKRRLVDAKDLTADSFAASSGNNAGHGPRDFNNSWLDIDDDLGSDNFTPDPPDVGSMKRSTVAFAVITVIGVLGLILVLFVPQVAGLLATIAGLLTLIGAVGLVMQLRGHNETRSSPFDDGARV
ncbi:MAG: hypothetical protein LKI93_02430 [Bifidobacteriaceae bacterium]|jgi:hypothetical protein|nr:hypothetical protein [Bifidobacteriaceae bacterium]MCI1915072.1 hypothetical protein [Bifidobacteriaceae bacterium]